MIKAKGILLAEDDEDDVILFINVVKEINNSLNIYQAKNGVETLNRLNEIDVLPDLIFMDTHMPVMNGFECLKLLKEHNDFKSIPVVILTDFKNPGERKLAYSLGASFFLCKPSDFSLFKRNISNMLNHNFLQISTETRNVLMNSFAEEGKDAHLISLIKGGLS
jgi:CheY-like chemotaxis protein